jgi:hypothetical protein
VSLNGQPLYTRDFSPFFFKPALLQICDGFDKRCGSAEYVVLLVADRTTPYPYTHTRLSHRAPTAGVFPSSRTGSAGPSSAASLSTPRIPPTTTSSQGPAQWRTCTKTSPGHMRYLHSLRGGSRWG